MNLVTSHLCHKTEKGFELKNLCCPKDSKEVESNFTQLYKRGVKRRAQIRDDGVDAANQHHFNCMYRFNSKSLPSLAQRVHFSPKCLMKRLNLPSTLTCLTVGLALMT